jgi:energy-coupling factor transport system ATP-binding protein
METRKVAYAVVLTALAVALGLFSIPVPPVKVSPGQHMVNVLSAVILGPWYALAVAVAASIIRNAAGTGTWFAFPGSMIGAFVAGYVYVFTRNIYLAVVGEIIGTGILGSLVSVFIVGPVFVAKPTDALVLTLSFLASTIAGSIIGVLGLLVLQRAGIGKTTQTTHTEGS